MRCEKCSGKCSVDNSRSTCDQGRRKDIPLRYKGYDNLTYRSNVCSECGHRFKSIEVTRDAFDELCKQIKLEILKDIEKLIN